MKIFFGKDILSKKNFFGIKRQKKIDTENRLYNKSLGGGAILDLGCYTVSVSILVASLISKIDLNNIKLINKKKEYASTGVDIDSYTKIKFENNFTSYIGASFIKNLGKKTKNRELPLHHGYAVVEYLNYLCFTDGRDFL